MISRFFIDRPIFAAVLSIVITLAGGIAAGHLADRDVSRRSPRRRSRWIAPIPGASAQVVAQTVATPIEQQVNGVENMLYMSSQCTNDGVYNLTVTFKHGVDLNMAQVLVQNRVSLAVPLLPDVIKQTGVTTKKKSPDILMAIALTSPDKTRDQLYPQQLRPDARQGRDRPTPGVSDIGVLGQRDYSMRIWVDPEKLAARDMTASDVAMAIRTQNMQVASGQIGQPPVAAGQEIQVPLSTLGRLTEPASSSRSSSRSRPTAGSSGSRTSPGSSSGPRIRTSAGRSTAGRRSAWPSSSSPTPTPSTPPSGSRPRSPSWPRTSPAASTGKSATTPPRSSASRSTRSSRPSARRSSSSPWWCCCSCRTGGRPSSPWSPCRWPSSAPSR